MGVSEKDQNLASVNVRVFFLEWDWEEEEYRVVSLVWRLENTEEKSETL